MVIDLFGLAIENIRKRFPEVYQHLSVSVKPERDINNRDAYKTNWWIFGEPRKDFRPALEGLKRYIATVETTKHRVFQFLNASILPDNMLVAVSSDNGFHLGVLSSRIHVVWALRAGGWLGVGNDPRYSKSRCFNPFPFPDANNIQKQTIRVIAEDLDAHRKRVLEEHPHLTLTGLYNVLEKVRAGGSNPHPLPALTDTERRIFDDGLVLILKELHDKLDVAVADAYGWPADIGDDDILRRLVALNKERAEEEKRGVIRWLRPDYQIPRFARRADMQAVAESGAQITADLIGLVARKPAFPASAVEQTAAVFATLATANGAIDARGLADRFRNNKTAEKKIGSVLASLARLGYVASRDGRTFALRRTA